MISSQIKTFINQYYLTVILLIIATISSFPSGSAFMLLAILPIFTPISFFYKNESVDKIKKIKLLIWFLFLFLVVLKHAYFHVENRKMADHLVEAVSHFKEKNGQFPKTIEIVGLSTIEYREKYRIRYAVLDENNPLLFYPTEFSSFQSYMYFFTDKKWHTVGG
jgi:hypothetical protein